VRLEGGREGVQQDRELTRSMLVRLAWPEMGRRRAIWAAEELGSGEELARLRAQQLRFFGRGGRGRRYGASRLVGEAGLRRAAALGGGRARVSAGVLEREK
jgi:hypothetical protein